MKNASYRVVVNKSSDLCKNVIICSDLESAVIELTTAQIDFEDEIEIQVATLDNGYEWKTATFCAEVHDDKNSRTQIADDTLDTCVDYLRAYDNTENWKVGIVICSQTCEIAHEEQF